MKHQPRDPARPPVRLRVKLLVVLGGVLVGLLIFEAALRVVGYTYPLFYTPDATRGWALRPGVEGWYRKEGAAYVRINSEGLRDREHSKAKPAGVLRIALLGDSYAEALQVSREKAFWSLLEERSQACAGFGGRRVEVINFGVSGYGTAQELFTLREKVWDYSPDVVLLAVTTNNDLIDNSRALKGTDEMPFFVLREGRLVLDDSFRDDKSFRWRQSALSRAGRWLRDSLRFVQAIHESHAALKSAISSYRERRAAARQSKDEGAASAAGASRAQTTPPPLDEPGVAHAVYREPTASEADAVWRDSWEVTESLLVTLSEEVKARGAKFMAVTLSNPIQVHPEPSARAAFQSRLSVADLFYPERRFKSLGERHGFEVFNLAPPLQQHAERNRVFLHGFGKELGNGHWNEAGHALAAELVAPELCRVAGR